MKIFYRRMLKNIGMFQNISKQEEKRLMYIHKHIYFSWFVVALLTQYKSKMVIGVFVLDSICLALGLLAYLFELHWLGILGFIAIPFMVSYLIFLGYVDVKLSKRDKEGQEKFLLKLEDKIQNISLLNFKVITRKEWRKIKKANKEYYEYVRSDECNHKCYETTRKISNILKNSKIRILWIVGYDFLNGDRSGHAVLKKGNWIYDTNKRRTYRYGKYIENYQAEVYKELPISIYADEYGAYADDYDEFGVWCKQRGATRSSDD